MDASPTTSLVQSVVGHTIRSVRRVFYEYAGQVRTGVGPLELTLDNGSVMLFDAAGDGEALAVASQPWVDPFREPMSEVNREFVRQSGKWTAFDATPGSPLKDLAGHQIVGFEEITSRFGSKIAGVAIAFATATLRIEVEADDLWVSVVSSETKLHVRRKIEPALEPYFDLLTRFVSGGLSADDLERQFLVIYKADSTKWSRPDFDALEQFFYAVDDYVSDPALRTESMDLDADQLRHKATDLLLYIKGSPDAC